MLGSCGLRPTMTRSKVKITIVTAKVAIQTQVGTSTLLLLGMRRDRGPRSARTPEVSSARADSANQWHRAPALADAVLTTPLSGNTPLQPRQSVTRRGVGVKSRSASAEWDAEGVEAGPAAVDGREHPGALRGHREGVLEVRGEGPVDGRDGPLVLEQVGVLAAQRDHRLDRE